MKRGLRPRASFSVVAALAALTAVLAVSSATALTRWVIFLRDDHPSTITVTATDRSRRHGSAAGDTWMEGTLPDGREVRVQGRPVPRPEFGDTVAVRVRWTDPPDVRYGVAEPIAVWVAAALATPLTAAAGLVIARTAPGPRAEAVERRSREVAETERILRRRARLDRRRALRGLPAREWPPVGEPAPVEAPHRETFRDWLRSWRING
jgi:hypothetical protein